MVRVRIGDRVRYGCGLCVIMVHSSITLLPEVLLRRPAKCQTGNMWITVVGSICGCYRQG